MAGIEPGCSAVCCNNIEPGITESSADIGHNTFQVRKSGIRYALDVSNELYSLRLG